VHEEDPPEALALLLGRVVDLVTLVDLARVDAEVRQLAERIGDDLERQRRERLVARAAGDLVLLATLIVRPWGLRGTREELDRV